MRICYNDRKLKREVLMSQKNYNKFIFLLAACVLSTCLFSDVYATEIDKNSEAEIIQSTTPTSSTPETSAINTVDNVDNNIVEQSAGNTVESEQVSESTGNTTKTSSSQIVEEEISTGNSQTDYNESTNQTSNIDSKSTNESSNTQPTTGLGSAQGSSQSEAPSGEEVLYRLYNPGLKVHLYTKDTNEYNVLAGRGWKQEGEAWRVVSSQAESVYRLYHSGLKVHLYTKDVNEYNVLANRGWKQEGVSFQSYGGLPIYRLYHPGLKVHLYTKDKNEYNVLANRGWRQEGIAFYGIGAEASQVPHVVNTPTATVNIQNKNSMLGTFDIVISNVASPKEIVKILVPVWSTGQGQDDLVWYEAQKQTSGQYKVSVQAKNHAYSVGEYSIHVYFEHADGSKIGATSTVTSVEILDKTPKASMKIENVNNTYGFFDVRIFDVFAPLVDDIQVAVWAENNGQNDKHLYTAVKQTDGSYLVPVRISNHLYEQGVYHAELIITSAGQQYSVAKTSMSISYSRSEIPMFIDVSSHNGSISVEDYRVLKDQGVKGVVVKLSEATSYLNPYAEMQVKNALAAGLKVSAYHYSHFTSKEEAREEARYFVAAAKRLNLPQSTLMVNDIEEYVTRNNINENMKAWEDEMRKLGFSNLIHYTAASWLDNNSLRILGPIETGKFGISNFWIAQYPYDTMHVTQAMSMSLHSSSAAWQFTSKGTLLTNRSYFDLNLDYTGRFTD